MKEKEEKVLFVFFFFFLEYMQRVNFLIIQRKQLAHTKNLLVIPTKVGEKAFPTRGGVVVWSAFRLFVARFSSSS